MAFGIRKQSRFERRSLARQRRVQRRLDEVQSGRARRGAGGRALSRKARAALFVVSLLLGLALTRAVTAAVVSWWNDTPTAVTAVAVQGAERITPSEVARNIGLARGHRLDAFAPEQIAEDLAAHPWIRSARVVLLPTGTVLVEVEERRPRAVLTRPDAPSLFVDADGVAFAEVGERDAAEALALPALAAGAPGEAPVDLADGLVLLDRLDNLGLHGLARVDRPHRGLVLGFPAGEPSRGWVLRCADTTVILGDGPVDAVAERLERLERLLSAGLQELERTREIDLRFAGQAVLRTEGTSG